MSSTFTENNDKTNGASPRLAGNQLGHQIAATTTIFGHTAPSANDSVSGKLVCGVGVNDLPGHSSYRDPETSKFRQQPAYAAWNAMINRVHNEKYLTRHPTYIGCSVHPDWLTFSGFKVWFDQNHVEGWCLDKDLTCPGNKVYGPENCRYVPPYLNLIVTDSAATRGEWPLGVTKHARGVKYQAFCRADGKQIRLGSFVCPLSAHKAWQEKKADVIHDALQRYMKERVVHIDIVRALIHYADRLRADAAAGRETTGFSA
jgi:hypothetical protein